jgi:hypothetical protein
LYRNLLNQLFDSTIAVQTVTSIPPIVTSFIRQCLVSMLDSTKSDRQVLLPVISNRHRVVPGELLALYKNPFLSLQTLEHSLKETLQSIFIYTSLYTEVCIDLSSLYSCPEVPAILLALDLLRPIIICIITGFVILFFAWSNIQQKLFPGT